MSTKQTLFENRDAKGNASSNNTTADNNKPYTIIDTKPGDNYMEALRKYRRQESNCYNHNLFANKNGIDMSKLPQDVISKPQIPCHYNYNDTTTAQQLQQKQTTPTNPGDLLAGIDLSKPTAQPNNTVQQNNMANNEQLYTYPRMMWDYYATNNNVQPLTPRYWNDFILGDHHVADKCQNIIDNIRRGWPYDKIKASLPVIMPHAQGFYRTDQFGHITDQTGGPRNGDTAIPSGLAMLDIDHVDNPADIFNRFGTHNAKENRIAYIGITPSTQGLRVIAERQPNETIPQAQLRLANLFGVNNYDKVTKDLARCSFCVPANYILYFDPTIFYFKDKAEADRVAQHFLQIDRQQQLLTNNITDNQNKIENKTYNSMNNLQVNNIQNNDELTEQARQLYTREYKGIPVREIAEYIARKYNGGQLPQQGNRHNTYLEMAKNIKTICDYDPRVVFVNLPDLGLPQNERAAICNGGYVTNPKYYTSKIPDAITEAVEAITQQKLGLQDNHEAYLDMNPFNVVLPDKLPKIFQTLLSNLHPDFHWAAIVAALPMLGAVATGVRMKYSDGHTHSFSFLSAIVARQSTGKSFIKNIDEAVLRKINAQSLMTNTQKGNNTVARKITAKFSAANYFKRARLLGDKHVIAVSEEIDQLANAEKSASMSLRDLLKFAFDNAETGCNYNNPDSFDGIVRAYINLCVACTPVALHKYIDPNLTDGLMTRFSYAIIKREKYEMPHFDDYTPAQIKYIDALTLRLEDTQGFIYCPWVDDAIDKLSEYWNDKMNYIDNAEVLVQLFPRALNMAFRAGYLASLCENDYLLKKNPKYKLNAKRQMIVDFTTAVFNYLFRTAYYNFGALLEKQDEVLQTVGNPKKPLDILAALPAVFSREQFDELCKKAGKDSSKLLYEFTGRKGRERVKEGDNGMFVKL